MHNDQYVYRPRKERNTGKKLIRLISFIIVVFASLFFLFFAIQGKLTNSSLISPLAYPLTRSSLTFKDVFDKKNQLGEIVQNILKDKAGDYGVVVMNLMTKEKYLYNEHKLYESASLYKLWVLGAVYEQIEEGKWTEETILSEEIPILNEKFKIATEEAELTEGEIKLPVNEALRKMITISDNYSAFLLAWKLRLSKVSAYMDKKGFYESKLGGVSELPITTSYDIALLFERLYRGDLANVKNTEKMISLLKTQQLNSKLPKYLPKNISIAHKTGELGKYSHDGGIIYTPKGDYVIVVLSQTKSVLDANEKIAQISKTVFDYFQNK